jgi:hypothetical protein
VSKPSSPQLHSFVYAPLLRVFLLKNVSFEP